MTKQSPINVTVATAYLTALALELMLRDIEGRFRAQGETLKHETKQKYSNYLKASKNALFYAERLTEDIFEVDAEHKWKNIPLWQEQSNELARLILLFADRSANIDDVEKIFAFIRSIPGEGIITEEELKNYYLKKL